MRGVALIGVVVINYHGYLLLRDRQPQARGTLVRFFDPWTGPLSTRFAATFVFVAGVGVTLLTRSSVGDPEAMAAMRWRLARRGIVLYACGLALDSVWPGTILPYYGAMFAVAGMILTWRARSVLALGLAAAVAGAGIAWWRYQQDLDGQLLTWFDARGPRSPRGIVLDVAVNGTHPLLPWLAFFCTGIVAGRFLSRPGIRLVLASAGVAMFAVATILADSIRAGDKGSGLATELASDNPFDRALPYTASALGTALVAYSVISWLADRSPASPVVGVLRIAGQMTLTLYVLHALLFNLVVDWLGWIRPAGLDVALAFAVGYWVVALVAASLWTRRFGRGPLEVLYRRLTA